jgi:hypothetical protein
MVGSSPFAWLAVAVMLLLANVPFLNPRVLLVGPRLFEVKPLWVHVLECLFWGLVALGLGVAMEMHLGQRHSQSWAFYTAFVFLFFTFAFPGFCWRFLAKHRSAGDA